MTSLRTVLAVLLLAVAVNGFTPIHKPATSTATSNSNTALSFGFLKELGLEKPSWLPDFGSSKEEAPEAAEPADSDEESEEAEASVEE